MTLPPDQTRLQPARPRAGLFGMWLFLAALTMLFASSILGYIIIRLRHPAAIELPRLLYLSTLLILLSSIALQRALTAIRLERQRQFRIALAVGGLLTVSFLAVQTPALIDLIRQHFIARSAGVALYGLVFFLIVIHALHVVGGVGALIRVIVRGYSGLYDHESHDGVRYLVMYWHFLDAVWLVMFATLLIIH